VVEHGPSGAEVQRRLVAATHAARGAAGENDDGVRRGLGHPVSIARDGQTSRRAAVAPSE
jgi:hypothetical protein